MPFDENQGFATRFIPCVDTTELLANRVQFLEKLFVKSRLLKVTGSLEQVVSIVLKQHENCSAS